jgi:hypothetical protein
VSVLIKYKIINIFFFDLNLYIYRFSFLLFFIAIYIFLHMNFTSYFYFESKLNKYLNDFKLLYQGDVDDKIKQL